MSDSKKYISVELEVDPRHRVVAAKIKAPSAVVQSDITTSHFSLDIRCILNSFSACTSSNIDR